MIPSSVKISDSLINVNNSFILSSLNGGSQKIKLKLTSKSFFFNFLNISSLIISIFFLRLKI